MIDSYFTFAHACYRDSPNSDMTLTKFLKKVAWPESPNPLKFTADMRTVHTERLLVLCVMLTLSNCLILALCTGWPNKNRTFFEIPYFCSHYRYNHAVVAEVFRNYSRKQQVTIF